MAHCRHTVQFSKNTSSIKAPQVRNSIAHPPSKHMKVSNYETIRQNIDGEQQHASAQQPSNTNKTKIPVGLN